MPLQESIKASFDPADVLASDRLFWMRKTQEKSYLKRTMEHNKQINYLVSTYWK